MKQGIEAKARKTKDGFYQGYIINYENNARIWSESVGVERITREDALSDANNLKRDREYTGGRY